LIVSASETFKTLPVVWHFVSHNAFVRWLCY